MAYVSGTVPAVDGGLSQVDTDNATDLEDEYSWDSYYYGSSSVDPTTAVIFVIYVLGFLVGLTGNLLVIIAVAKSRRLHNVTCVFLANLAVADLLTVTFLIPIYFTVAYLGHWSLGEATCRISAYLNVVSPVCSIFTMMIISLERYYVVLHPLLAKSFVTMGRAKRVVAGLWVASSTVSIPALFSKKTNYIPEFDLHECVDGWPSDTLAQVYSVYLFILLFLGPLVVVSYAYMMLGCHLWSTRERRLGRDTNGSPFTRPGESRFKVWYRNPMASSSTPSFCRKTDGTQINGNTIEDEPTETEALRAFTNRTEDLNDSPAPRRHRHTGEGDKIQRVVTMLAIVVTLFILSWGPLLTYSMVNRFYTDIPHKAGAIARLILHLVAALNSCVNPIIYAFLSKNFRQSFKQVIRDCCCCCDVDVGRRLGYTPSFRWTRSSRTSYSYTPPTSLIRASPQRSGSSVQKTDV